MNSTVEPLVFYDAIYQKVVISDPLIQDLIFTKEFQRLKHIRQLGTLPLTLNSTSTHSRFSHCLGVYHLINSLLTKSQFNNLVLKEKREIGIAGLLHDLGHGPFSHIFEKIVHNFVHEEYSVQLIKNPNGGIYPLLEKYNLDVERITNLILHQTKNDWAQSLISNQFDFDRLDYLLRDRYFVGLSSSAINLNRLLDNILIVNHQLVFHEKALLDLENYLTFRFYMHKTFFWNAENIFLDNLFVAIFQRLKDLIIQKENLSFELGIFKTILNQKLPDLNNFLQLTDYNLFHFFTQIKQQSKDLILQKLVTTFLYPSMYKPYLVSVRKNYFEKLEKSGWPKKYFFYENTLSLNIYTVGNEEILICDDQKKIQKFSKISIFFNQSRFYQTQLNLSFKSSVLNKN